jgi:hypothetical protein
MKAPTNNLFTAAQVARAAAITRQAVHAGLQPIASAGVVTGQLGEVAG